MERKTVKVACSHPGGLTIRLTGAEGSTMPALNRVTLNGPSSHSAGVNNPSPRLQPAATEVDAKFWDAWTDQNRGKNPLLDSGVIYEVQDDETRDHVVEGHDPTRRDGPDDGPTVQQWVDAGYRAENYPPGGYKSKSSPEEIDAAIKAQQEGK